MLSTVGAARQPAGMGRVAFSPTQAFSCFFPPVSVQQCPTRAGRDLALTLGSSLGCDGVKSGVSYEAAAAFPLLCPQAQSGVMFVCVTLGPSLPVAVFG